MMNNVKVSLEEVVWHFLRTQSHKAELRGIVIPDLSLSDAIQRMQSIPEYQEIAKRIIGPDWHLCFVDESLFHMLKALRCQTWLDLSDGSLKIVDVIKNLMEKDATMLGHYALTKQKVADLVKLMAESSELFDWRIIVERHAEDCTVLDGTCRAVAMAYHFSQHRFNPFWAYVGFTKTEL